MISRLCGHRAATFLVASIVGAVLAVSLPVSSIRAHEYKVGSLEISHPWTRATPHGARVAGGFLTITNHGRESDRLIAATFEKAGHVEIHEMSMAGGMMKMKELPNGVEIKPGQTIALKPGSFHLMFMALKDPVGAGKKLKGTLMFAKAGKLEVQFTVEAMGTKSSGHDGHQMGGDMMKPKGTK